MTPASAPNIAPNIAPNLPPNIALIPKVAIVIPVFKHSVLVGEAITCALQQEASFDIAIVIVNDGCPYAETDRICREFAIAHPDRIVYLRRQNGGLSAARNTGIEFALSSWASVEAIYLLDADNRITPKTIDRAFCELQQHPGAGWIYPSIQMFGQEHNFDFRGSYSALRHLKLNLCEAGSLVRRTVFEAGCRYDESMKLGFEDWEFWWQAIEAGFRGKHLPQFGFQYRRRPESMLKNSERDGAGILDYMRRKHKPLFSQRQIVELEHQEAPRYAIVLVDREQVILTSDPEVFNQPELEQLRGRSISLREFQTLYSRAFNSPTWHHRPHFLVFTRQAVLESLQQQGLLRWVFWRLELAQSNCHFSGLSIEDWQDDAIENAVGHTADHATDYATDYATGHTINHITDHTTDRPGIRIQESQPTEKTQFGNAVQLIMTTVKTLDACILDAKERWIHSLISSKPIPKLFQLRLQYGAPEEVVRSQDCVYSLLAMFKDMRRALAPESARQSWNWQEAAFQPCSQIYQEAREVLDCGAIYPIRVQPHQRHIGFILPILEFGGVEKVAINIARSFHAAGWHVHLFIFNSQMQDLPTWANVFASVNFLNDPQMLEWGGSQYAGSTYDRWSQLGDHQQVLGLMGWLDAVINFHSVAAHGLMGLLRRRGVKTMASLHVHDLTPWNRSNGFSYLTLGYEHAYDFILPCSQQMADWCHAIGVPEEKLMVVPNACGYPLSDAEAQQILDRRQPRSAEAPLRVLYLGRFDRQKGLDRLVNIVSESRRQRLPIEWRLVGKNIVQGEDAATELAAVADLIEPPALTTEELNALYEWADVLLLPSYWEGLPLTILEAMRLGVVVCAADVGAVREAIEHQQTGILLPNVAGSAFVQQAVEQLAILAEQPDRVSKLSQSALTAVADRTWSNACAALIQSIW